MKIPGQTLTIFFSVFLFCCSCTQSDNASIEKTLSIAGNNSKELIKVIKHYRNSGDEEKLAAAEFLIANMPGHYSYADNEVLPYYYSTVDSILETMAGLPPRTVCDSINAFASRLDFSKLKIVEDATVVTAGFLIDNIDTAFRQWRQGQWVRHLTFDEFCEYLLPYKAYEFQPLQEWR